MINLHDHKMGIRGTKALLWMSNIIDKSRQAAEDEDIEYVRACQRGDINAFEVLVKMGLLNWLDVTP